MPSTARRYTVEEVLAFPADGNRYELVHGELLVTPAPSALHQVVVSDLLFRLQTYLTPYVTVARAPRLPSRHHLGQRRSRSA